jgi:hypothetical protein
MSHFFLNEQLRRAVTAGNFTQVTSLLARGADPRAMESAEGTYARSLVATAAFYGRVEVLRVLLSFAPGFDLNQALCDASVPLKVEEGADSGACIALLLAAGADPCHEKSLPLRWATVRGNRAAMCALHAAGSSLSSLDDAVLWAEDHFNSTANRNEVLNTARWGKAHLGQTGCLPCCKDLL